MNRSVPLRAASVVPRLVGLGAVGVALLGVGLAADLAGMRGPLAQLLSMDAPGSASRMFVTGLLAATAVVAALGARRHAGRRMWWTGVALAAGLLALTKGLGTAHSRLVHALGGGVQAWHGMVLLGLLAAAGLLLLWRLSGDDRRDRRRLITVLALHAVAAVGLSAGSTYVGIWAGRTAYAAATFVEESAESLTAVALLAVVLLGVAPRLVLPAGAPMRRRDDELPALLPRWASAGAVEHRG